MIATLFAAALTGLLLARCRVRPGHRLRDLPPRDDLTPPPPHDRHGRRRRRRRRPPGPSEFAAWCDALAREARSGSTLIAALRAVEPPASSAIIEVRHRLERGVPLVAALEVAAASVDEQAVLTVLAASALHGGGAAQPLDRLAATLRRRAADAAERAVHSAQARLSAIVMTVLPGGVLVLLLTTSGSVRDVTASPVGMAVVLIGSGLNLTGWWWMRRLIGGDRRWSARP